MVKKKNNIIIKNNKFNNENGQIFINTNIWWNNLKKKINDDIIVRTIKFYIAFKKLKYYDPSSAFIGINY